eukprot:153460-Amphidinium_carterae.1
MAQPLVFGDAGISLEACWWLFNALQHQSHNCSGEETQLAHLMELRATAACPSPTQRRHAVSLIPTLRNTNHAATRLALHGALTVSGPILRHFQSVLGLVDQYQAISTAGEAIGVPPIHDAGSIHGVIQCSCQAMLTRSVLVAVA